MPALSVETQRAIAGFEEIRHCLGSGSVKMTGIDGAEGFQIA